MHQILRIYNSLTRQKEVFQPLRPPFVGMYLCGPTVYGKAHLGHARAAITFDIIFRYLDHLNYKVRYVRNITDVGHLERDLDEGKDKIQQQAKLEAVSPMEVAQRYTYTYRKNMEQLNVLPPSIEPCASGHILEQIAMIEKIIQNGLAYIVDGSVYFDVAAYSQMHHYGKLSGRSIAATRSGTRTLAKQRDKKERVDFALWKKATPMHSMHWPSPWGAGFPGWHIECSAMSTKYLGKQFDIHGGGMDLLFPHHECEIAQAQAALKTDLVTYWIHNNLVTIDGVKMGKSLGNFITLDELFTGSHLAIDQPYSPMALRFFMLQAHYRSTLSITIEGLKAAYQGYRKLMNGLHLLTKLDQEGITPSGTNGRLDAAIHADCSACYSAINDDFNTAKVLASLFNLLKKINGWHNGTLGDASISSAAFNHLRNTYTTFMIDLLGLKEEHAATTNQMIETLLTLYQEAKAEQRYNQIDCIRTAFHKMGIAIKDHPNGVSWAYQ
ncbi:MAG: cysteine--tRNA ligase [Candidatus Cardinium sp.]|uniref:cysteine--tRNA ligase n=1 Tax=Cardinium endosymbiont of Dermatophagoides farinae TaxID=2597823 RepID=UPI0011827C1B|nr:cysteine--tRNA ligase [Cardinium endosymbiont of Dermatophagoides farinae]TSJ81244.1 cysteine--tRNA ligase [Cardinium endosymbiont of Dermatophagoides farinae]UWW97300.1 MAG: cysteine--tRNA ligase [Candidatus Cardinium sp.]